MKSSFAVLVFVFALTSQAGVLPNAEARLQLQRALFGNDTTKTERMNLLGRQSNGESCVVELRKTRFGVYVGIAVLPGKSVIEAGVTNSNYTTQNLDFVLDESSTKFSRLGITGINERGEDYSHQTAALKFEKVGVKAELKSVEVTYEVLAYDEDKDHNPIYTPTGEVRTMDCTAF